MNHAINIRKSKKGVTKEITETNTQIKNIKQNITLDIKPEYTVINTYSLNQLEDDKHIKKQNLSM